MLVLGKTLERTQALLAAPAGHGDLLATGEIERLTRPDVNWERIETGGTDDEPIYRLSGEVSRATWA